MFVFFALAGIGSAQQIRSMAEHVQVEKATSGHDYVARRSIGHVEAIRTVHVRAAVEGFLTDIAFKEGDLVREGDVLFRIDPLRYQAAVKEAKANLQKIDAQIIYASNNYKRLAKLAENLATSKEEMETALAKLEELKASRAGAQANLAKAEKDLQDCTIRAEISGRLGRVEFSVSNYITAGEQLATLTQMDPIYVRFPLSQTDVNGVLGGPKRIRNSTDVRLYTADGREYPTPGSIEIVDNLLSGTTDSYTLWAKFDNKDGVLVPHGIGALVVRLTDSMEVTMTPLTAVHHDSEGSFVYTVADDGTVARRDVISGSIRGRLQSIYDGLKPGEVVITDGAHKTRQGARVIPVYPEQKNTAVKKSESNVPQETVSAKTAPVQMIADPTVLEINGARVEAINKVELRPLVQGILAEPEFREGDRVKKGDVLFRIDPTRYQATVDAQKSSISVLDVRIADAERKLERQRNLLERNATSQDDYESAQASLEELKALRDAAEAQLTVAEDDLSRCTIRAGMNGRIGRVNFSKGNFIAEMKSPLATLVQISPIYVRFPLSESTILSHFGTVKSLVEDSEISLITATGKALQEKGRVAFCDNIVQAATDTMNIWGVFNNEQHELQPGGVVTIRLMRKSSILVPAIPAEAVQIDTRGRYAFVLRHGRAQLVRISCGSPNEEGLVPVYKGVHKGDVVITTNLTQIEDGVTVQAEQ